MVGCRAVVLALSTARELGLAGVAAAFILFALVSALVVPSRYPNFPGQQLGWFVAGTVLFFAAMILAVALIAREPEGEHEATPAGQTETQTRTQGQTTESQGESETEPAVQGDPAAGKPVFASAGCATCHTLSAAGSSGTIGPNLDDKKPDYDLIVERVTNGKSPMPSFKGQLSDEQIHDVAAFVYTSTHS
jgi:mono/diheme cytochrome c family protein